MNTNQIGAFFSRQDGVGLSEKDVQGSYFQDWFASCPGACVLSTLTILASVVLWGTGGFATLLLIFNLFIRLPYSWLAAIFFRIPRAVSHRSIFVISVACMIAIAYASHLDKAAQSLAMPAVSAIESFKSATGTYPKTLGELVPTYLNELPTLKPVVSPPDLRYQLSEDGAPLLEFEATGGAFAHFSYDFGTKKWSFLD